MYNAFMKYIDLTHKTTTDISLFPGTPKPEITQVAFHDECGYNNYEIKTTMHVGTHMDGPNHMVKDGEKLVNLPVDRFIGKGHLIDVRGREEVDVDALEGLTISKGDIVLLYSGLSDKYDDSDYYLSYPVLTEAFAKKMSEIGIKIIGLDFCSPDKEPYSIHPILLGGDVLIIENLTNLKSLIEVGDFKVIALPAKFDADSAPVRVVAEI